MAGLVERLDQLQRDHPVLGLPLGVVYKYADDEGGYLAATLTYYAFVSIFPLLLIASSVLGFLLRGDPSLSQRLLDTALSQFPIVGTQLGRPEGLQGSVSAVVVGGLTALYGVIGLGQAAARTVNVVWAVPRNSRLNPVLSRARSLLAFVVAGLAVVVVTVLSVVLSHLDLGVGLATDAVTVLLNVAVLATMMRLATGERQTLRATLPGACLIAVLWQVLQSLGGLYVEHVIRRASDMAGLFAVVLGLIALIYIATVTAVLGMELNVVLARRLYPRALLTPFTDDVELTDADRRAYTDYAKAQRHKGFQRVRVSFRNRDDRE